MQEKESRREKIGKVSIRDRLSKVTTADFATIPDDFGWFEEIEKIIPNILAGKNLKQLATRIVEARKQAKPVILMMGAHVVKCGLGGLIAHLIRRDLVTAVAMNGACAIHDIEIALWGKTSEDVETSLKRGEFGMTAETAAFFAEAAELASRDEIGLGEALIATLEKRKPANPNVSILASAGAKHMCLTVHVAIGTDVVHQHTIIDGASLGSATMRDFWKFGEIVANLDGGVVLNLGSAVIMPEVFLKAMAMARSKGIDLGPFTTANFDMYDLYRPRKNVVERPRLLGATTYSFLAHHEIILPLLFAAILAKARP